jgi:tripeptidyl-peptidase-1
VSKYLAQDGVTPTTDGYFNTAGRGYPDLAAYGSNYFVYLAGKIVRESGTSASAPVIAGMVALWNDMRFAYGMPSMGFINPFLYQIGAAHPEAFYDVTTGDNACGAGHSHADVNCCDEWFTASAGWDAVNGWGSPNFHVIANLVLNSNAKFPSQGSILTEQDAADACSCKDGEDGEDADSALAIVALVIGIIAALAGVGALYFVSRRDTEEHTHLLMNN